LYHCDNLSFIGGSNLTATKARLLLMACLMKFGALSPAAKTDQPTAGETAAVQSDIPSTASCQNARRVRFPVLRLNAFRWFRGAHLVIWRVRRLSRATRIEGARGERQHKKEQR